MNKRTLLKSLPLIAGSFILPKLEAFSVQTEPKVLTLPKVSNFDEYKSTLEMVFPELMEKSNPRLIVFRDPEIEWCGTNYIYRMDGWKCYVHKHHDPNPYPDHGYNYILKQTIVTVLEQLVNRSNLCFEKLPLEFVVSRHSTHNGVFRHVRFSSGYSMTHNSTIYGCGEWSSKDNRTILHAIKYLS
jgi:hypothetical protein